MNSKSFCALCAILFVVVALSACSSNSASAPASLESQTVSSKADNSNTDFVATPIIPAAPKKAAKASSGSINAVFGPVEKIPREVLPTQNVNSVWDGKAVHLFGARNETISFLVTLSGASDDVSVYVSPIEGVETPEVSVLRYLEIKGLSRVSYDTYDERHIPKNFQGGTWKNRPWANKHLPDILVPQKLFGKISVKPNESQAIFVSLYIPANTKAGNYNGEIVVDGKSTPIQLEVYDFELPYSTAGAFVYLGNDVGRRIVGEKFDWSEELQHTAEVRGRFVQMLHSHGIGVIEDNEGGEPSDLAKSYLDGSLFTKANGYEGYGEGVSNGIYSIGTYGSLFNEAEMVERVGEAEDWFKANAPKIERFVYLVDESEEFKKINSKAEALHSAKSTKDVPVFVTGQPKNLGKLANVDILCATQGLGEPKTWESAKASKTLWMYNGLRPLSGSFATEDDQSALRELVWCQYKLGIQRWFYWESTYWNNFQAGEGESDVINVAHTFGSYGDDSDEFGQTGWNYANGDGVLLYPGKDVVFPESSYDYEGPLASLRLEAWFRGLQDYEYLKLANKVDPKATHAIVERMVPKALWENGVSDPSDPTWVRTDTTWPTDAESWEEARKELAEIILGK